MKAIFMKVIATIRASLLAMVLGTASSCYAVQEHHGEKQAQPQQHAQQQQRQAQAQPQQHAQQQQRQAQARPQQHAQQQQRQAQAQPQQHAQQQQRQAQAQPQQHPPQQDQSRHSGRAQEQRGYEQRQQHPQERQRVWQEHRAGNWQSDHRNWQQRGGYNGYQIPQERYHGYFGVNHGFRIGGLPFMVVGGFPRFQYGGYWFSMIDPWPGEWADDWYDSDDVYVDYMNGGYYLFDRMHPGVGIAISVSM